MLLNYGRKKTGQARVFYAFTDYSAATTSACDAARSTNSM